MVSVLNNGGGYYDLETYIQEIRNHGGLVHPPCINKSDHPNVIHGKDIYLGFGYLKGLESKTIQRILKNRQLYGVFQSFDDFIDRIKISIEQLSILLKIDAFRFTGFDKHHLLWNAHFKLNPSKPPSGQEMLFKPKHRDFTLPEFQRNSLITAYDQIALLRFSLYNHFHLLQNPIKTQIKVENFKDYVGKGIQVYGDLISISRTRTSRNDYMYFGTFYDCDGNILDTVHFPKIAEKYPVHSKGIFLCRGMITSEFGYRSLQLSSIERQTTQSDPRLDKAYFKAK